MQEFVADPEWLSMRDEIGLVDSLTAATLQGLDLAGSLDASIRVAALAEELVTASTKRPADAAGMRAAIEGIREQADVVRRVRAIQDRALELIEQRRRLADTERKRVESMTRTFTVAEAYALVDALWSIVQECVTSGDERAAIHRRLQRILDP